MKISATIITFNEEKNIADCLASLDFVDEIIVVDSGSTDKTEELCRANPRVRYFRQGWQGYGKQKNRAAELAAHDWVLNLDADERVTPELRTSILSADLNGMDAFRMARENYFGKRWIRHCGWYPDHNTRFYNRTACRFSERPVHETLECHGRVGTLEGNLLHYTYGGIEDYLRRMPRYSALAAEEIVRKGRCPGVTSLLVRPVATFFRMYLLKRGFLEGETGLQLSLLYATYTFCKYARARELLKGARND